MIWRSLRPSKIVDFIKNNQSSSLGGTPGDAWRRFLRNNGGTGETFHDLETSWLGSQEVQGNTLRDKLSNFFTASGQTIGYLWDRGRAYLQAIFGGSTDRYLAENGDLFQLEDGSGYYILE